jgi:hypothetical protein
MDSSAIGGCWHLGQTPNPNEFIILLKGEGEEGGGGLLGFMGGSFQTIVSKTLKDLWVLLSKNFLREEKWHPAAS